MMMRMSKLTVLTATMMVAACAVAAQGGCSVVTNETAIQCVSEQDCLSRGPAFVGTTCDATTKTCLKVAADQDLCTTNRQCIDRAGGVPAICRKKDRKCATLQTPECPTVHQTAGQLLDDNAIVIGALTPAGHTELGDNMEAAMALAHKDLSTSARGLPQVEGSSGVRPLVILSCREFNAGGFDSLNRAANHLAKTVNVPVVIGPVDPANDNFVLNEVFIPNRVLSILPTIVSTSLTQLPGSTQTSPLVWGVEITDSGTTNAAQELVSGYLEAQVRAQPGFTGPVRIALMLEDNFFGQGGAAKMEQKLRFNNKSAVENLSDGNYLRVSVGNLIDPVGNPAPDQKVAEAVGAVLKFNPHIVLHSYAPAAIPKAFFGLAFAWPGNVPHAYHVDLLHTWTAFAPLLDVLTAVPPLRERVFAPATHVPDDAKARMGPWLIRFKQDNLSLNSATAEGTIVQVWYDATFLAAYAIAANRGKPLTGENLAATLPQFLAGPAVVTGPDDVNKAFSLLNSGQTIDLAGLSGAMNLDPRTGIPGPDYDIDMLCPELDPQSNRISRFKDSKFFTKDQKGQGAPVNCGKPK
jgi:hypothetical protein